MVFVGSGAAALEHGEQDVDAASGVADDGRDVVRGIHMAAGSRDPQNPEIARK
jgi:hypothetical protein